MKKIKILRVIARLNIGGPAIHAVLLTEGLDNNKFDSLLVCGSVSSDEGDMSYYAMQKNIHPYFIPELKRELNFFSDLAAFRKIYKVIREKHPDIVHTHTAKAGTLGRLAAIVYNLFPSHKKIKLAHTFHGHIFSGYFNPLKTRIFIIIEQFLARFSHTLITVSESVKNELISYRIAGKDKIKVISLGLELNRLLEISPRKKEDINIGIVGRLAPVKNHRLFLETAAVIIKDEPAAKIHFKIIGDGGLKAELEEYSRSLNISHQVDFLGWQRDLPVTYSDLDIVALTSLNEGTPVSLIEAMAAGRAIVATDVGGVRDLVGRNIDKGIGQGGEFAVHERGIIVSSRDACAFSKALLFLLRNGILKDEISAKARAFVQREFSKERLIKDIEDLYDNMVK